jgi:peptidoglycan hydrolase-like protein with peptidoglycan-binding domain
MPRPARVLLALAGTTLLLLVVPAVASARAIHLGDHGAAVRNVQRLLVRDGFPTGVDGVFGPGTQRAVMRFQRAARLPVVGYVGPHTMAALRSWRRRGHTSAASQTGSTGGPPGTASITPGGYAIPPSGAPGAVVAAIAAGNRIARTPYKWGGGHRYWNDTGYDCSGSVSYALHAAKLLSAPLVSGSFARWGAPGRGRWITIYANSGHVFMVVAGIRFDTSGQSRTGSRWQPMTRSTAGFAVTHPVGF